MHYTRYDYLRLLLQSCSSAEPAFDIPLAGGGRMPVHSEALIEVATRAGESDRFLEEIVPLGAIVDVGSVGRALFLLAHRLLHQHLHRAFSDERLAFDPVLLTSLDRLEMSVCERRKLAKRRVFAIGDLLALPHDERLDLLEVETHFLLLDQLGRMGAKDLPYSGWPPRSRVVRLQISADGSTALQAIPLDSLPLAPRVACALELGLVERVSDIEAEQWAAIKDAYRIPADVVEESEHVFASFGLDVDDTCLLEPGDRLFGADE